VKGKNIVVGISGGIAAYKAAELVRLLMKSEALTNVAMTTNAAQFVTPVTFEALSGNRVICNQFRDEGPLMEHITWGQEADLVIIAPATANIIGKIANGIGDDFLSTMLLATTAKILVCPSMNSQMYINPAVQDNLKRLKERDITVMAPGEGQLACRTEGPGRLPEPADIVEQAEMLLSRQDLSGLKILLTAGATVEPIDPVRFITNRSTGKMGYALARAAKRRGASVTLISGPTALPSPYGVTFFGVKSAEEMKQAVFDNRFGCDIIIKAAAVADYRPLERAEQKIKKGTDTLTLELTKNPDILAELGATKKEFPCVLVGFAAETEELLSHAKAKLEAKNLDMIVANDVSRSDAGFEADTNIVKMIYRNGDIEDSRLMSKDDIADLILDRAKELSEKAS
jgi:phosphopantothenoylcysteine decarboxylase/phosphopantothenate--cysteine ligase